MNKYKSKRTKKVNGRVVPKTTSAVLSALQFQGFSKRMNSRRQAQKVSAWLSNQPETDEYLTSFAWTTTLPSEKPLQVTREIILSSSLNSNFPRDGISLSPCK